MAANLDYLRKGLGLVVLLSAAASAAASFTASNWQLSTGVVDSSGSNTITDGETITVVPQVFQYTSFASLNGHSAQADFDFVFQPKLDLGAFNTDIDLHVGATNDIQSSHSGHVRITPDVDLPIHIDALLDYATPSTPVVDVRLTFAVFDVANPIPPLFFGGGTGGTITLNPPVGTLSTTGDRVMLAGHTYQIQWQARILTLSGPPVPGGPSDASGYINFSFVPEPASALGMLAVSLLYSRRPRRHR